METLPWDINQDGIVDVLDLIIVSQQSSLPATTNPRADVQKDGKIDIFDIVAVASHFGETGAQAAPGMTPEMPVSTHALLIERWLAEAKRVDDSSAVFQRGILMLDQLLDSIVPDATQLLSNFPNPFNPETWIAYELAEASDVTIEIYSANGERVRQLSLGHQTEGHYVSRARAAYWDGRNDTGERIASGVYFYTFRANDYQDTRKMMILK